MDPYTATEQAYRNGYAEGFEAGKKAGLPCKIGDRIYGLRRYGDQLLLKTGKVCDMYYDDEMRLVIHARHVCRGFWGRDVFGNEADALAELKSRGRLFG